jgi:hypothetical protein
MHHHPIMQVPAGRFLLCLIGACPCAFRLCGGEIVDSEQWDDPLGDPFCQAKASFKSAWMFLHPSDWRQFIHSCHIM